MRPPTHIQRARAHAAAFVQSFSAAEGGAKRAHPAPEPGATWRGAGRRTRMLGDFAVAAVPRGATPEQKQLFSGMGFSDLMRVLPPTPPPGPARAPALAGL